MSDEKSGQIGDPNKKKRNRTSFKKGGPGGPGRPKLDGRVKNLRSLNIHEFLDMMVTLWKAREPELVFKVADPDTPAGEKMIAKILLNAIETGDHNRAAFITNRFFGMPKETVTHDLEDSVEVTLNWGSEKQDSEDG